MRNHCSSPDSSCKTNWNSASPILLQKPQPHPSNRNAMKAKLITQIVLCLLLLFALGGVCGYAMSSRIPPRRPAWTQSREWAAHWMEHRMATDFAAIQATPEQREALRPAYDALLEDFHSIQNESAQKIGAAFKRHGTEVRKHLSPAQREQLRLVNQSRMRADRKPVTPVQP